LDRYPGDGDSFTCGEDLSLVWSHQSGEIQAVGVTVTRMEGWLACILALIGVAGILAVEKTIGQDNTGRKKHDMLQDEILKAMKDSGVLNEWKDKLDDMLYKENEIPDDHPSDKERKGGKKSMLLPHEKEMITNFINEYIDDKKVAVKSDLILSIVERVQKTPKPNLGQLFVQLGPIIDVVSAIQTKTKDVEKIIERQAPVFDSPAKPKDVLHTLAENLKSELVRLTLDSPPPVKEGTKSRVPPPPPKKERKTTKSTFGGLDMADYLTLGSSLLKGGNAAQMMDLLSGKADFSSLLNMLPSLMENGNYKDILSKVAGSYLEGTPYAGMAQQVLSGMLDSQQGKMAVETFMSFVEKFIKSESGKRLTKILPKLAAAQTMEDMLKIIGTEAEWNWSEFFSSIENSDYEENFISSIAEYIVTAYDFVVNPPKDSMIGKVPMILNGFLISNRIPAFDSQNPVDSLTKIVNKCIKLFTTWKLDITPWVKSMKIEFLKAFNKQAGGNSWSSLRSVEKTGLVSRLIDHEVVEPVQQVWGVYRAVTQERSKSHCGQHLLCEVNRREAGSKQGPTRVAVLKSASMACAWALSKDDVKKYTGLQQSVQVGSLGQNCNQTYPVKKDTCSVFKWQKKDKMNLKYDEL